MKIVDVNILINAISRESPHHQRILAWWEDALSGTEVIGFCWPSLLGFVRIASHPHILPSPVPLKDCIDLVESWLAHPITDLIYEADNHWFDLKNLLLDSLAVGNLVPDAHLAALAISRGATLVSCDTDFARFRHLRWENPLV